MELIVFVVAGVAWYLLARNLKKRGKGVAVRHGLGAVVFLLVAGVLLAPQEPETNQRTETSANSDPQTPEAGGSVEESPLPQAGPESVRSENWEYVVNNAIRTADAYATENNPNAVFFGPNVDVEFIRQAGGEHEGRHLLKVLNEHGGNTSFMMLLPLFDESKPTDDLDDEGELWEVVVAKLNGKNF